MFSPRKNHSQKIVVCSWLSLLRQTHKRIRINESFVFWSWGALLVVPPLVHVLYSGAGLLRWAQAGLTGNSALVPLVKPWSCQPLGHQIPVLTRWPSHCSLVDTGLGNRNFLRNHWGSIVTNHWTVTLLQGKEYIGNYGIYCTRRSEAFNLKCKQRSMKYLSSCHLLERNAKHSGSRLAPFVLSVWEQRQPVLPSTAQLPAP